MFYTYAYCNELKPINDVDLGFSPFYIGKGSGRRILDHLRDAEKGKKGKKLSHIRRLIKEGNPPIIVKLKSFGDEKSAFDHETSLIAKFGRLDLGTGPLFNNTPGGDGPRHTLEVYAKIAKKLRGRKASVEHRENIANSLTGRTRTNQERDAISAGLVGKTHGNTRKENISLGTKKAAGKWTKRWLVTSPETAFCILSLESLREMKLQNLYSSYRRGAPISRGKFRGWQLQEIK